MQLRCPAMIIIKFGDGCLVSEDYPIIGMGYLLGLFLAVSCSQQISQAVVFHQGISPVS